MKAQVIYEFKNSLPATYYTQTLEKELGVTHQNSVEAAKIYLELGRNALTHNEDLATLYELKAKEIFHFHHLDSMVALTNLSMTFPYINQGKYKEANDIINEVFEYAKRTGNKKVWADAHLRLGYKEYAEGNFDKALKAYLTCYEYFKAKRKNHELGDILMRIGTTYSSIGDCETAIQYWMTHINALKSSKTNSNFSIPIKSNMVDCYLQKNDFTTAKSLLHEVINARKNSNSFKILSNTYLKLSKLYKIEKNFKYAEKALDTSFFYAHKFKSEKIISEIYYEKAELSLVLKNNKEAIANLNLALNAAKYSHTPRAQLSCYKMLSEIYYNEKKFDLAFQNDSKADSIKDKMFSAEIISSIKNLEKEIGQKNSNEKIALLESENELKNKNIKQQKKIKNAVITLLALTLLVLILLLYIVWHRNKVNKLLNEKNNAIEKSLSINKMLVKEIHHRVKNNMQIVASLLGLQSRYANDKNVNEAITSSKTRVQAMSILHQNLYMNEDLTTIPIKKYFEDLCDNLASTYGTNKQNIFIHAEIEDFNLDLDQVVTLGLIINEFITNAIKHAFVNKEKGEVSLNINKKGNQLYCTIVDDGIGMAFTKIPERSTSMGMQLISSFVNKLEAGIKIDNNMGTKISLSFKIENHNCG